MSKDRNLWQLSKEFLRLEHDSHDKTYRTHLYNLLCSVSNESYNRAFGEGYLKGYSERYKETYCKGFRDGFRRGFISPDDYEDREAMITLRKAASILKEGKDNVDKGI